MAEDGQAVRGRDGRFVRTIETAQRDAEAARLRGQGLGLREIAQRLGLADEAAASKAISRALAAVPAEAVGELRVLESERLDALLVQLQPGIEEGDVKAITEARKISESRRRLHGLDGAVKVDMSVNGGVPGSLLEQVAAAKARIAAERAQTAQEEGEDG